MMMVSSVPKQWIIAIITILIFSNIQQHTILMRQYFEYGQINLQDGPTNDGTNIMKSLHTSTQPEPALTLVLLDPHFLGGFRNQHMRFVAFVDYATSFNISQILLPSIHWGDAYFRGNAIGHEYLFDVQYWNDRAKEKGLPRLVRYDAVLEPGGSCFNVTSELWNGLDEEFLRSNTTNMRKIDLNEDIRHNPVSHCRGGINNSTYLIPLGAGKGAGLFWGYYFRLPRVKHSDTFEDRALIEQSVFQLLRPSLALRTAMDTAVRNAVAGNKKDEGYRLMALHPRVEQEMMTHRCHVYMEQNLTKVFQHISTYPSFSTNNTTNTPQFNFDLIFVAVSAFQVLKPPRTDAKALPFHKKMIGNKEALLNARINGVNGVPIFESGASTATQVKFTKMNSMQSTFSPADLGAIELTASIINFFTSVSADIFVGVKGSTFSNDVFAVRHYVNKDVANLHCGNYIVGKEGIEEMVGPPRVHNC